MTAEEFLSLGETSECYELVDGVVSKSPKPSRDHQRILSLLIFECELFKRANPGVEYYPDIDVCFDARHVYQPDLCVYRAGRVPALPAALDVAPDLVVEILSPSNRAFDLVRKRADYGRFGVREYWVFDPADGKVRCFRNRDGQLAEVSVEGDTIASEAIEGFVLRLSQIRL